MTTDQYGRVIFHDGEGVQLDDLNDTASRGLAVLWDQVVRELIPNRALTTAANEDSAIDRTTIPYALALTTMGARPAQGSGFNKIKITAGTLMQVIAATPTGSEPSVLAFSLPGTNEVTIANGDPTNPRVDIVQMKLEYLEDTSLPRDFEDAISRLKTTTSYTKRRRVQCTLSVKQGTPASSPTYPTPDAGFCVIAGLVVGTNCVHAFQPQIQDSAGAVMVIHDQRMPLRIRGHVTPPGAFVADFLNIRARQINGFAVTRDKTTTDAAPSNILVPILVSGNTGRLVQVSAQIAAATPMVSKFCRYVGGANDALTDPNIMLAGAGLPSNTTLSHAIPTQLAFQAAHAPDAGPTVQASANGVGPPIWTNGFRAPALTFNGEFDVAFPVEHSALAVIWLDPPDSATIRWTTFFVAEGL